MRRYRRALAYAGVVPILALAACGGQANESADDDLPEAEQSSDVEDEPTDSGPEEDAEPEGDPVGLTLWIVDRVSQAGMDATRAVVAEWEEATGNTVEVVDNSFFELMNKMPVAIPAGDGPDAFMLTNNYIGQFKAQNLIAPVDLGSDDTFLADALRAFTLEDEVLGVPLVADVNALVYNRELLPEIPATMEELVDIALERRSDGQYGLLFPIDQFWWSWAFMAGEGGYIFGENAGTVDVDDLGLASEGSVAGLEYVAALVQDTELMPADTTADVADGLFMAGEAAAIITGPTVVPTYAEAGIDVGVAAIPPRAAGAAPAPFATYTGFAVSVASEYHAETSDLLRYLGEHLPARLQAASSGNIPAVSGFGADGDEQLEGWLAQLANSYPLPSIPEMNYVFEPAATAVTQAVHGQAEARSALEAAEGAIQEALAAEQ